MVNNTGLLPLFAKLHKVNFLFDRISDRELQKYFSITLTQYHILIGLQIGPCSPSDIAQYWGVSKPAISRQVEGLRIKGLVKREENPLSRREQILTTTQAGVELFAKSTTLLEAMFNSISHNIQTREKKLLEQNLDILLADLRKQAEIKSDLKKSNK